MTLTTKAEKKYQRNQEVLRNYVEDHNELNDFVNAFKEMQKADQEGRKTVLDIIIGKSKKKGFLVHLSSYENNPRILFSSFKDRNNKRIPSIDISTYRKGMLIASISLGDVRIISSDIGMDNGICNFDVYSFVIGIADKFDYDITMYVYKK